MHCVRYLLLLLILPIVASACTDVLAFDLTTDLDEITIPGDKTLHQNHVALDMSQVGNTGFQLKLDGVQGQLDLLEMNLYITEAGQSDENDEDNFDFLQSLTITIVPEGPTALPSVVLGTWDGPGPSGTTAIEMTIQSPPNLTEYIANGARFELDLEGIVPPDELSIGGDLTFLVNPI